MDRKLDKQLVAEGLMSEEKSSADESHISDLKYIFKSKMFWIVALLCVLYYSASQIDVIPKHTLLWTLRTQALWAPTFGVYLQPTIQYLYADGLLAMFKISVGPEIGYKRKTGFEYGGSARIGAFFDMLNFEMGYLVNSKRTYINIILNLPTGLGIWV